MMNQAIGALRDDGKKRFDEVRLGDSLGSIAIRESGSAVGEQARHLVLAWSGASHADLVSSLSAPEGASQLTGRVFAKHMNGSRLADVQIVANAAGRVHDVAVVRVELG